MYHIPVKKIVIRQKQALTVIRLIVFLGIIAAAFLFSAGLIQLFGIKPFFSLAFTAASLVFVVVLIISLFIYRPFCRIICPTGLLFLSQQLPHA